MNVAVLLAAGKGQRMGDTIVPKQFLKVDDLELFLYSLMTFDNCRAIHKILMVTRKEDIEKMRSLIKEHKLEKKIIKNQNRMKELESKIHDMKKKLNYMHDKFDHLGKLDDNKSSK